MTTSNANMRFGDFHIHKINTFNRKTCACLALYFGTVNFLPSSFPDMPFSNSRTVVAKKFPVFSNGLHDSTVEFDLRVANSSNKIQKYAQKALIDLGPSAFACVSVFPANWAEALRLR
jgi:hypothetical protein